MVYSTEGGVFLSSGRCVRRLEYFIYVYYPLLTWRHLIETECKHEGFGLGLALNLAAFALFIWLVVVYFDRTMPKTYILVSMRRQFHPVIRALYISCVFITAPLLLTSRFYKICSIFRIAEFATCW